MIGEVGDGESRQELHPFGLGIHLQRIENAGIEGEFDIDINAFPTWLLLLHKLYYCLLISCGERQRLGTTGHGCETAHPTRRLRMIEVKIRILYSLLISIMIIIDIWQSLSS